MTEGQLMEKLLKLMLHIRRFTELSKSNIVDCESNDVINSELFCVFRKIVVVYAELLKHLFRQVCSSYDLVYRIAYPS